MTVLNKIINLNESQLEVVRRHWYNEPVDFCVDIFGDKLLLEDDLTDGESSYLFDRSIEIMKSVRDFKRTVVKACYSSSKTFTAARIALWFLTTRIRSKVITTAPTNRQVEELLWNEIATAYQKAEVRGLPIGGRLLIKNIKAVGGDPNWFATGFSTDEYNPQKFQGYHAPHILIIVDEANGISQKIYESIDKLMTSEGAKLLLIGNPLDPVGEFYDAFGKNAEIYNKITITAFDTPNIKAGKTIIPGLITNDYIDEVVKKHGKNSLFYQTGIEAMFPSSATDSLIPLAWIELANKRWEEWQKEGEVLPESEPEVLSVDPGQYGNDPTAYMWRIGNIIIDMQRTYKRSLMETVASIQGEINRGCEVIVDVVGIGAGVGARLDELNLRFYGHSGALRSKHRDATGTFVFENKRGASYWKLHEALNPEGKLKILLPPDDELQADLTSIKYKLKTGSPPIISITTKEEVKKILGRSPDLGDCLAMSIYNIDIGDIADAGSRDTTKPEIKTDEDTDKKDDNQPPRKKQNIRGNYSPGKNRKTGIFA